MSLARLIPDQESLRQVKRDVTRCIDVAKSENASCTAVLFLLQKTMLKKKKKEKKKTRSEIMGIRMFLDTWASPPYRGEKTDGTEGGEKEHVRASSLPSVIGVISSFLIPKPKRCFFFFASNIRLQLATRLCVRACVRA